MARPWYIVPVLVAALAALSSCATKAPTAEAAPAAVADAEAEAALADGWKRLWADDFEGAKAKFASSSRSHALAHRALRGLALACAALDEEEEALDAAARSIEAESGAVHSAALRDAMRLLLGDHEASRVAFARMDAALIASASPWSRRAGARDALDALEIDPSLDAQAAKARTGRFAGLKPRIEPVSSKNGAEEGETGILLSAIGVVKGWEFIGPFPGEGGRGMARSFIDEAAAAKGAETRGATDSRGRPVDWIAPSLADSDGRARPAAHSGGKDSAYYARARVEIAEAGDYWMIVDRDCGMKAWVGGILVLDDPANRAGSDMHWERVTLPRGKATILVKLADWDGSSWFRISLMRADRGAGSDAGLRIHLGALAALDGPSADPVTGRIAAGLEPEDAGERAFWLALGLARGGEPWAGMAVLDAAERGLKRIPDYYAWARARCLEAAGRASEARSLVTARARGKTGFPPFIRETGLDALRMGSASAARDAIEAFPAKTRNGFSRALLNAALAATELPPSAGASAWTGSEAIRAFKAKYPGSLALEKFIAETSGGNSDYAFLAANAFGNPLRVRDLAWVSKHASAGRHYAAAHRADKIRVDREAGNPEAWASYIMSGRASGLLDREAAEKAVTEALSSFPKDPSLLRLALGFADERLAALRGGAAGAATGDDEKKAAARRNELLRAIFEVDPADAAAGAAVANAEERSDGTDPLAEIRAHRSAKDPFRGKDATVVLDEKTYRFRGDGGFRLDACLVVEAVSARGALDERERDLARLAPAGSVVSLRRAYAVKRDGSFAPALAAGARVSFPGLEAGDCVVISYAAVGSADGSLSGEFWVDEDFADDRPIARKRLAVRYPKGRSVNAAVRNDPRKSIKQERLPASADSDGVAFSAARLPAMPLGSGFLPREVRPWADVSSLSAWERVSSAWLDLADERARPTRYLSLRSAEAVGNAASRADKIKRLYDLAARIASEGESRGVSFRAAPSRVADTLDGGGGTPGDKAALLIARLRAAGIEADYALFAADGGGLDHPFPGARFDRVLVAVRGGEDGESGEDLLLDPGAGAYTCGELPRALDGGSVVVAASDGTRSTAVGRSKRPPTTFFLALKAGQVRDEARGAVVFHGEEAARLRTLAMTADREAVKASFADAVSGGLAGAAIGSLDVQSAESLEAAPVALFTAGLPGSIKKSASGSFVEVPWPLPLGRAALSGPAALAEAGLPAKATITDAFHETIVIELPKGSRFKSLPLDARLEFGSSYVNYSFRNDSLGRIICEREYRLNGDAIDGKNAPLYEEFAREAEAKQKETIPVVWL